MFHFLLLSHSAFLLVTALPLLATPDIAVAAQNGTKLSLVPNPSTRGTLEIVTTSLLTIIACTWSVLHLNVPGLGESALKKTRRRLKWTLMAIIFPEMIFMSAIDDWFSAHEAMKDIGKLEESEKIGAEEEFLSSNRIVTRWTVERSRGFREMLGAASMWLRRYSPCDRLLKLATSLVSFSDSKILSESSDRHGSEMISVIVRPNIHNPAANDHDKSELLSGDRGCPAEESIANSQNSAIPGQTFVHKRNIWTLTHTYCVNMGGIRIMTRDLSNPNYYMLYVLRADSLAVTTFDPEYHPLKFIAITEDEILDKSTSESFAKAIASLQFAYLVLSAISRADRHLGLAN